MVVDSIVAPGSAKYRNKSSSIGTDITIIVAQKVTTATKEVKVISRYLSRQPHAPQLEEGETYEARIIKVEEENGVDTQWGPKDRYVFTFEVEGLEIKQRYNKSMFPKSNYVKLITTLDPERFDGIGYDADDLVGKPCRVLIKHTTNEETGDVWENIDGVLKPKKESTFRENAEEAA